MEEFQEMFQSADWKEEKHVPVIDIGDKKKKGEIINVRVCIGKEVAHPNTTEHHIRYIELYFKPENGKFPCNLGRVEFNAHGESAEGPDTSTVYTHHDACFSFKTEKNGVLYAVSYCNIHGLWKNQEKLELE